jgi:hypothetical protein
LELNHFHPASKFELVKRANMDADPVRGRVAKKKSPSVLPVDHSTDEIFDGKLFDSAEIATKIFNLCRERDALARKVKLLSLENSIQRGEIAALYRKMNKQ